MRSLSFLTASISTLAVATAQTYNPTARWGQKAVYSDEAKAVYYVGGEVSSSGAQITNEVLVLPLNTTNPAFLTATSTGLPPTAFGTLSYHYPTLYHVGGLTQDCSSDALVHTLDISSGANTWVASSPAGMIRRRGAAALWTYGSANQEGEVMVTGGMIDEYVCSASTYAYPATDILRLPLTSSAPNTLALPSNLTGTDSRPVTDFAMALLPDGTTILGGGADVSGNIIDFTYVGLWSLGQGTGFYGGWEMVKTSGEVPAGRVGHNMVAHPTLDMLIMHGGSTLESSTSGATSLLSFLNLTTYTWSTPSNLQPPASAARAWHSSIVTPSGVLISAFGLDGSGQPRNDVVYLDMRDSDMSKWGWKSQWSEAMINGTTITSTTTGVTTSSDTAAAAEGKKSTLLKSILIPTLVILFLGSPFIVFLARRHVEKVRSRRMAQHFELDGEGNGGSRGFSFRNPFDQFTRMKPRRSSSFASSGIPREPNSDEPVGFRARLYSLAPWAMGSSISRPGSANHGREMAQIAADASKAAGGSEKVQWEEIDFGLGKVDESRRNSSAGGVRTTTPILRSPSGVTSEGYTASQMTGPMHIQFRSPVSPRDYQARDRLPSFSVQPPSIPNTPNMEEEGTPLSVLEYPVLQPVEIQSPTNSSPVTGYTTAPSTPMQRRGSSAAGPLPQSAVDEWSSFATQLESQSIFQGPPSRNSMIARSPSPSSQYVVPPPSNMVLPPLDFQRRQASTVRLVQTTPPRRGSESQLASPFSTPNEGISPRSTSAGRNLLPALSSPSPRPRVSALRTSLDYSEPSFLPPSPTSATALHRLSNPPPFPIPSSPLPSAPVAESSARSRDLPRQTGSLPKPPSGQRERRQQGELRVVNVAPEEGEGGNMY